jgi:hypothetical protein
VDLRRALFGDAGYGTRGRVLFLVGKLFQLQLRPANKKRIPCPELFLALQVAERRRP